jgi:hypothetical protein
MNDGEISSIRASALILLGFAIDGYNSDAVDPDWPPFAP